MKNIKQYKAYFRCEESSHLLDASLYTFSTTETRNTKTELVFVH